MLNGDTIHQLSLQRVQLYQFKTFTGVPKCFGLGVICESQNISYPMNVWSGQSVKYYIEIIFDLNILSFYGVTKTVIKINNVGMWFGKDLTNFFEGSHSVWDGNYRPDADKYVIEDYYIAVRDDHKNIFKIGKNIESDEVIFEIKNYLGYNMCLEYIKMFENCKNKTIIDENIISTMITYDNDENIKKNTLLTYSTEMVQLQKFDFVKTARILKYVEGVESSMHIDRPEFNTESTHRFLIYLSDFEGGDLEFENQTIKNQQCKIVVFNLRRPHRSNKVTKGVKYIITGELCKKQKNIIPML